MHPFQKRLALVSSVALWSFLAAASSVNLARAQSAGQAPFKDAGVSSFTITRGESHELIDARLGLEQVRQRFDEKHPEVAAQRSKVAMLEQLEPSKISFEFQGGNFEGLVKRITASGQISLTLIKAQGMENLVINIPPFSLRNASVKTVVAVFRNLLSSEGIELDLIDGQPNAAICTLRRLPRGDTGENEFTAVQLSKVPSKLSPDEIVAAIRSAWELEPAHDPKALLIKFHPGTKMLLVYGPKAAILVTERVVAALPAPLF